MFKCPLHVNVHVYTALWPYSGRSHVQNSTQQRLQGSYCRGNFADSIPYTLLLYEYVSTTVYMQVEGQPALKFAAAYGFRNIQNLVQKMKREKCPYLFVEVMACPSGARAHVYM